MACYLDAVPVVLWKSLSNRCEVPNTSDSLHHLLILYYQGAEMMYYPIPLHNSNVSLSLARQPLLRDPRPSWTARSPESLVSDQRRSYADLGVQTWRKGSSRACRLCRTDRHEEVGKTRKRDGGRDGSISQNGVYVRCTSTKKAEKACDLAETRYRKAARSPYGMRRSGIPRKVERGTCRVFV